MTALNRFSFSGYTMRPACAEDLALAAEWTARDKYHAGVLSPKFWLEQGLNIDSILMADSAGPLFFFKVVTRTMLRTDGSPFPEILPAHLIGISKEALAEIFAKRVAPPVTESAAEIFIQFMPQAREEDYERTRGGLIHGAEWVERMLRQSGIERIFFDTEDERLLRFARKRLGFKVDPKFKLAAGVRLEKQLS